MMLHSGQRARGVCNGGRTSSTCPRILGANRRVVFTARVPKHVARRSATRRAVPVAASAVEGNGSLLPWQAAMDEVQKRKDLKSIMIIGAGPIVIGQVRQTRSSGSSCRPSRRYIASLFLHFVTWRVGLRVRLFRNPGLQGAQVTSSTSLLL